MRTCERATFTILILVCLAKMDSGLEDMDAIRALVAHRDVTHLRLFSESSESVKRNLSTWFKGNTVFKSALFLQNLNFSDEARHCQSDFIDPKAFVQLNVLDLRNGQSVMVPCLKHGMWLLWGCKENCSDEILPWLSLDSEVFFQDGDVLNEIYKLPVSVQNLLAL